MFDRVQNKPLSIQKSSKITDYCPDYLAKFYERQGNHDHLKCLSEAPFTAQKMKSFIKDFFSKCDQILNGKLHSCAVILSNSYKKIIRKSKTTGMLSMFNKMANLSWNK